MSASTRAVSTSRMNWIKKMKNPFFAEARQAVRSRRVRIRCLFGINQSEIR
jgi:hypothetical protein